MDLGQTNPELRRILLTIVVADGSAFATSVDGLSPTLLAASNSASLVAAGGSLHHVSNETRLHYYEASAAEALIPGFLLVVVIQASILVAIGWAPVGPIFSLGEASAALRRLPLTIYNLVEPPGLATGATVTTGSDLQSSINARAFANDPGSLVEIGHGAFYWQAGAGAVAEEGWVTVKYESTGFGLCLEWVSVSAPAPAGADGTPPVLGTVTPDPDEAPGSAGAFPLLYVDAKDVPIVIPVVDADSDIGYLLLLVLYGDPDDPPDDARWQAIYAGRPAVDGEDGFRFGYRLHSTMAGTGLAAVGATLTVRRDEGWPGQNGLPTTIAIDTTAVDTKGNVLA